VILAQTPHDLGAILFIPSFLSKSHRSNHKIYRLLISNIISYRKIGFVPGWKSGAGWVRSAWRSSISRSNPASIT